MALYFGSYCAEKWLTPGTILVRFLKEIGIALVVSTFIVLMLERLVHASLLGDVEKALEAIRKGSDVLDGTARLGIEDVLARHETSLRERWETKVRDAIGKQISKGTGEILIACVAAPEFFRQGTEIGDILWEGLSDGACECNLKVLLLCRSSKSARLRATLEPGHPALGDIKNSARYLYDLKKSAGNKINFNCYSLLPQAFLIVTDDLIFMEAYPMVKVSIGKGPIGGRTPMIIARKDTETYRRWRGHFEYVWKNFSTNYVNHHASEFPH